MNSRTPSAPPTGTLRIACAVAMILLEQSVVCGLAMLPAVALWQAVSWVPHAVAPPLLVYSLAVVPSYVVFALALLVISPAATRLTGARSAPHAAMRIRDLEWQLLAWARYMAAIHVVRVFAGGLFRGSPMWTAYIRLNGARLGRRVFINTLFISDHNLLEFGDDVVIGSEVHVSGHTVEGGIVKTAPVRIGRNVTVGLGSVIEIGAVIGPDSQIGALSFVPKHTTLPGGAVYVGSPVRKLSGAS